MQLPERIKAEVPSLEFLVDTLAIVDPDSLEAAKGLESDANALRKKVQEFTGPFVKNAHKAWKDAKAEEAKHLKPVEAMLGTIKGKINAYAAAQAREARAKAARIAEAAHVDVSEVEAPVSLGPGFRDSYQWEIEDETKIPAEYWVLDEKKINAEVRSKKMNAKIPGIKFTKTQISVSR